VSILDAPLEEAQTELALAELALLEATARAEAARDAAQRLSAAVAALNGENPVGPSATPQISGLDADNGNVAELVDQEVHTRLSAPQEPDNPARTAEREAAAAMSPEEFDKERKRKQRRARKEQIANNPLGHLKCPGCGETGNMTEQIVTTPKGGVIKALCCGDCGNQAIMA